MSVHYQVDVAETRNASLAGRGDVRYLSPPQQEEDARQLIALLGGNSNGAGPWCHPIAGGVRVRTIQLTPAKEQK